MPFDEEEDQPSLQSKKIGIKQVSSQPSIFDKMPKKPSQESFHQKIKQDQESLSDHKVKAAELVVAFSKAMNDKTLSQNKTIFAQEMEKEIISKMIYLGVEINNDEKEEACMGSMGWILILLKTCFAQRDRINNLEFSLIQLEKKIQSILSNQQALDNSKTNG